MNEPATGEVPPNPAAVGKVIRWFDYGRPLAMGWFVLFLWAVADGKCAWASRWNVGWGVGLLFGGLTALLLGLPHALLQWGLLFLLKRFTRLAPGTRAWLATLPVLVAAVWMLGERYIRWQPKRIFTTFVQQPAPASLRILDISAQQFEFSEPQLWGIEFTVEPADWASVTNGYAAMAASNDQARESDQELRKQEDELRAEMEQFVRKEISKCGMELPMKAPFRVLRRTQGDIAARVNSNELRPDWGDFLFFRDDQPGYAFFFRGMIGDDLARLSAP